MDALIGYLHPWVPAMVTLAAASAILLLLHVLLIRRRLGRRFTGQVVMLTLTLVAMVSLVAVLPVSHELRGQLLSLLGLVLSAAIALSSTTFVGNAVAGLMLRGLRNFSPGDFVRVGEHFGRVSERGLFHTEIQTEDSDLTTLPNLFLVTNPVTVVRAVGTIVSATVSLGYDVARSRVRTALLEAATAAQLEDGFVQVTGLGDFSITYRVAGRLREVTTLLSARSHLREAMLDALHGAGVEIVSPTFMNTRGLPLDRPVIPPQEPLPEVAAVAEGATAPEAIVFDKAEEATIAGRVAELLARTQEDLRGLDERQRGAEAEDRPALVRRKEILAARVERLTRLREAREARTADEKDEEEATP